MSYDPNYRVVRDEKDSPAPWHVWKLDGTGELHLSDWDAMGLAARIRSGMPREDDEWRIPPARWDDHPHVAEVSRAAYMVDPPEHVVDHDRYAAELLAALADRGLAVVPCTDRAAARRGIAATGDVRRLVAIELREHARRLAEQADALDAEAPADV